MARELSLDPEKTWQALKFLREAAWQNLPLKQMNGTLFGWCLQPGVMEQLHRIDQSLGGAGPPALVGQEGLLSDPNLSKRLVIRSLMEEAIDSSRIEGAVTTRQRALDLLRSGKPARDKSERMVVNNYAAMQWVKARLAEPLSVEMLLDLQRILTSDTLEDPGAAGRLRTDADQIAVVDSRSGEPVFVPPPAPSLVERLKVLCDFANAPHRAHDFLHPVAKACVLHFMIGYEHPFVDGNGRTARAVFYWQALRSGYRIFEFLVISELILKAYARYPQALIDSEDDNGDLTYFVEYKLRVIERSIARFQEHLQHEHQQVQRSLVLVRRLRDLNLRQRLLLEHAVRHPKAVYTVISHARSNQITPTTARADLESLRRRRLLSSFKSGKQVQYVPAPDLAERVKV